MLHKLILKSLYKISVYDGISPSLLATMSLSVNIAGKTHEELIDNLVKNQLIQQDSQIYAYKQLNRQLFTKAAQPYQNKPYPISKGQTMTDIFTHSVFISNLAQYWKDNMKILQIGTGHGYLSFLIATILQRKGLNQYSIKGIDINDEAIQYCRNLQKQIQLSNKNQIDFESKDLGKFLELDSQTKYDAIIGGYYIDQNVNDRLIDKLKEGGVGIWPTRSESGQALYKIQKGKDRVYLIQTMFSMPVVRSQVSKYFVQPGEEQSQQSEQSQIIKSQSQNKQVSIQVIKAQRLKKIERAREQLKVLLQKYRKTDGKILKLEQMRQVPQIRQKLEELDRLNIKKVSTNSSNSN